MQGGTVEKRRIYCIYLFPTTTQICLSMVCVLLSLYEAYDLFTYITIGIVCKA